MSETIPVLYPEETEAALTDAHIENAFREGGVLSDVARTIAAEGGQDTGTDDEAIPADDSAETHMKQVGDALLPPKGPAEASSPRWVLIEGADGAKREAVQNVATDIEALARKTGMKKDETIPSEDVERVQADKALWVVEDGANRTSVVRRSVAVEAMRAVYGEDMSERTLIQLGSDRVIPETRPGKDGAEVENPEFAIAKQIAPDYMAERTNDAPLTSFELNMATALQDGYAEVPAILAGSQDVHGAQRVTVLQKEGFPTLLLLQPEKRDGTLRDGFQAVAEFAASAGENIEDLQFVVATNGQYRAKDALQAELWARQQGVTMEPPVVFGDEPGYQVEHNGVTLTTADRAPLAYVNEAVVAQRLEAEKFAAWREQQHS